jgi:adenosylhomocysteine nucleosidase
MSHPKFVVIISANIEWKILKTLLPPPTLNSSPLGQWFEIDLNVGSTIEPVLFFHGGWGKIAAAASTQYVLDRWSPRLLVNLGTCGGFEGEIEKGTIILVERTLVYDIIELMGDHDEHLAHYTTRLDLSWLKEGYPQPVRRTLLVSADRDVLAADIPWLKAEFGAVAGDWESAAIAWVAARHQTPCLILRGVSDLIGGSGGEAYDGNIHVFVEGTTGILRCLIKALPDWLMRADI